MKTFEECVEETCSVLRAAELQATNADQLARVADGWMTLARTLADAEPTPAAPTYGKVVDAYVKAAEEAIAAGDHGRGSAFLDLARFAAVRIANGNVP